MAHPEGKKKVKACTLQHHTCFCRSRFKLLFPQVKYFDQWPCVFVHVDLMGYADNDGNLTDRDLEHSWQYICWTGTVRHT